MTQVSIAEASINLASLITLARSGEEVIITDGAMPFVRLAVPTGTPTTNYPSDDESIRQTYGMSLEEFRRRYPDYAPPPTSDGERVFGNLDGQGWMSDDFDEPLEDFEEYM
jgi:antitoxin (DNA-binding transcriptional repressor) of toxin-antitoxin stability system